jgi:hypothetical protein
MPFRKLSVFGLATPSDLWGSLPTFVLSLMRFAYLPRTNLPKSERLYSDLPQSSSSVLAFFINSDFAFRCQSSTYNSNYLITINMGYLEKQSSGRSSKVMNLFSSTE